MTTPRYPKGCSAGSQVRGEAFAGDPAYAWGVNLNNGNVNANNRNNHGFGLAVRRVGEFQGAPLLRGLYDARRKARRQKVPSHNQLRFDYRWMDGLVDLERRIAAGTWSPGRSTCFIARQPKAREIHAPDFADRVVHHWAIPPLEAIYEPVFIFDSYANRAGKGSHAAVRRLQSFVRQVQSGEGDGWYLQLDIHNFFNSIPRQKLWAMLKARMQAHGIPEAIQRVVHALLRQDPLHAGVDVRATPEELACVPPHKRLANAAPGCGLPIGNLSSQFFANVFLDPLDQFAKHVLGAKRYLRYVDDFVLVHRDRGQLEAWLARIQAFLATQLALSLKDDIRLRPLRDGIDFLGYVVHPTHTRVRRRVVAHATSALSDWQAAHVTPACIRATPADLRRVASIWASYTGHFAHANSWRLQQSLHHRFPWLASASVHRRFAPGLEGRTVVIPYHQG